MHFRRCGCRSAEKRELAKRPTGTMFLTALLRRNRIPGRQWIGKHRRPRTVSFHAKQNVLRRLETEAENHYWLSAPFLSAAQEFGHAAVRRAAAFQAIKAVSEAKFPPHRRLADQLSHLNVTKKWS
ncbi:large ribosomal subunit protein mL63 [Saccopteryx bilineata]|uniref:large ribosomal subunit protein mL63 n=1 Tax=Saccopteryx bilineata TaxID=59482 RepID=UPI00338EC92F